MRIADSPQYNPLNMNIQPGLPRYYLKIGKVNMTIVAPNQLIIDPYGIMLGLTISAIYSQTIGPRVKEKVPLIINMDRVTIYPLDCCYNRKL